MDNKFELVFNERDDAAELKNLPIDDNMHGIIEEEELDDEGSDEEEGIDNMDIWGWTCATTQVGSSPRESYRYKIVLCALVSKLSFQV